MKTFNSIGIMSGTSLDGLDIVNCIFKLENNKWEYDVIAADTILYPKSLKLMLSALHKASALNFAIAHKEFGQFISKKCNEFIKSHNLTPQIIGCHGHTIFHIPKLNFTFQIGSGAEIAANTGIKTVCDFRTTDTALKGQGAPLVPIGDKLLFYNFNACINIGGFANISYDIDNKRVAHDICPANFVLNKYANMLGEPFDKDGNFAKKGKINQSLIKELNKLDHYNNSENKISLSREWVEDVFSKILKNYNISHEDMLRTLTEHIALQLAKSIPDSVNSVLITGGGAFNKFLIKLVKKHTNKDIVIPDETTINYKEAIIFAFLAILRVENKTNILSSVTNSLHDSCSGAIYG